MFTFLAAIFSAKWISEHSTEIIIGLVFIIVLIIYAVRRKKRIIQQYAEAQRAQQLEAAAEAQRKAELQRIEKERAAAKASTVKPFPADIDNMQIEYSYRDVVLIPEGIRRNIIKGEELEFAISDDQITVKVNAIPIGYMKENRLAGMVRDWYAKGDPCKCYFISYTDDGPMIAIFFYSDVIGKFLKRNPEAKLIKLAGKPEDLAFYDVGNQCIVEQDLEDPDKFVVTCDNATIGRLPASGISYAEKHDCSPEDLSVIIAEIDYDIEKERDIISVYIAY